MIKYLLLLSLICVAIICYAEDDFFTSFGFKIENETGLKMKILWDEEHSKLVFRMFKSDTEYYEGTVPLIRVWEGEAE